MLVAREAGSIVTRANSALVLSHDHARIDRAPKGLRGDDSFDDDENLFARRTPRGRDPLEVYGQARHLGLMVYAAVRLASHGLTFTLARAYPRTLLQHDRLAPSVSRDHSPLSADSTQ